MTRFLVGSTGFVGGNLASEADFDGLFHSTNIQDSFGKCPDLLVYAGVKAAKFLANSAPEGDWNEVSKALSNIKAINPKRLVLISTIDVIADTRGVMESTVISSERSEAYGANRLRLEREVQKNFPDALIVRLPALFGKGLKKNFIFDMMTIVPSMLAEKKFLELGEKSSLIKKFYEKQENGFYKCQASGEDFLSLKAEFERLGFTSLLFTDSRAKYQFYNLANLWRDIETALKNNLTLLHLATEPVSAAEIYEYVYGKKFTNELNKAIPSYDYRTNYAALFGGEEGSPYIAKKEQVLHEIKTFVENPRNLQGDTK